jgi:hypothetical protein
MANRRDSMERGDFIGIKMNESGLIKNVVALRQPRRLPVSEVSFTDPHTGERVSIFLNDKQNITSIYYRGHGGFKTIYNKKQLGALISILTEVYEDMVDGGSDKLPCLD